MFLLLAMIFPLLTRANPEYDYYYDYGENYSLSTEAMLVNSSLTLDCGVPVSGATIYHNHQHIDPVDPRLHTSTNEPNILRLKLTTPAESGRWTCQTSLGVVEKAVVVNRVDTLAVLAAGELVTNSSVIHLRRDLDTQIVCAVISGGKGNLPLGWEYDAGPLEFDLETFESAERGISYSLASLSSQNVINSKATTIICRSETSLLQFQISEEFRPEFTISRSPGFGLQILEEMSVTLRCKVESSPPCVPVWEHNGSPLPSLPTNQSNSVGGSSHSIAAAAEGWYQCSAQHKFGNFSSVG